MAVEIPGYLDKHTAAYDKVRSIKNHTHLYMMIVTSLKSSSLLVYCKYGITHKRLAERLGL